jgi:hypothetical protein
MIKVKIYILNFFCILGTILICNSCFSDNECVPCAIDTATFRYKFYKDSINICLERGFINDSITVKYAGKQVFNGRYITSESIDLAACCYLKRINNSTIVVDINGKRNSCKVANFVHQVIIGLDSTREAYILSTNNPIHRE